MIGRQLEIANLENQTFFSGKITDVNAWDKPLSTDDLQDLTLNCKNELHRIGPPNLINWQNATIINSSSILRFNILREETCVRSNNQISFFNVPLTFENSLSLCNNLGGQFPLPKNKTEYQQIISQAFDPGEKKLLKAF